MSANVGMTLIACGFVQYNAGVPTFTWQNGGFVNAITDTGVGLATITLDVEVDPDEGIVQCVASSATADDNACADHSSDTTILVTLGDGAGAASDHDFWISVYEREFR